MDKRIVIVSELYYPESNATGYYLTGIAEGLAGDNDVRVVCCQPTYDLKGTKVDKEEIRNGVHIKRCNALVFSKNNLIKKIFNVVWISMALTFKAIFTIKSNDIVMVVTNPPTLPHLISVLCKIKRASCIMLVQDVYPDAMVAAGIFDENSVIVRILKCLNRWFYKYISEVVVLGRDMHKRVLKYVKSSCKLHIIPNWGDVELINKVDDNKILDELNLLNKFVVQLSGNIGRTHDIDIIIKAARELQSDKNIVFFIVGGGVKKRYLEKTVQIENLSNVVIKPKYPRERLGELLSACDIAIISMNEGMCGVSVPSRMYNIMAAGKAILAVVDEGSEVCNIINEEDVGFVIRPGDELGLVRTIRRAALERAAIKDMGRKARRVIVEKYTYNHILNRYKSLINHHNYQ
jgi:colanic acid biosynthesis glycosyl transferase WcaI